MFKYIGLLLLSAIIMAIVVLIFNRDETGNMLYIGTCLLFLINFFKKKKNRYVKVM